MKVVVGSKNPDKIKIVKDALTELHLNVDVIGVEIDSGITNQPLDKETTQKGAINRAKDAKRKIPNADFWIGLEGGLHDYHPSSEDCGVVSAEGYNLVTYACLIDKDNNEYIGEGEEIHLPVEVSEKIKKGEWFGKVIREYAKEHEIDQNLITRVYPFTQAIQNSYAEYLRKYGNLGYRKKASAVVVDNDKNFLIVQLVGYGNDDWNFCGGGIEKGESEKYAILRELKEELGGDKFEILKKTKLVNKYEWPVSVIAKRLKEEGKTWRGQESSIFFVRFVGNKKEIIPNSAEVKQIKWIKAEEFKNHFHFPGQLELAERIIDEFNIS